MTAPQTMPQAPVSWGELLDKITILEIKSERIKSDTALANVRTELSLLRTIAAPVLGQAELSPLLSRLKAINESLWEIEDRIRLKDAAGEFDQDFIALARAVYVTNDERADVKKRINSALGSALVEEKSYQKG